MNGLNTSNGSALNGSGLNGSALNGSGLNGSTCSSERRSTSPITCDICAGPDAQLKTMPCTHMLCTICVESSQAAGQGCPLCAGQAKNILSRYDEEVVGMLFEKFQIDEISISTNLSSGKSLLSPNNPGINTYPPPCYQTPPASYLNPNYCTKENLVALLPMANKIHTMPALTNGLDRSTDSQYYQPLENLKFDTSDNKSLTCCLTDESVVSEANAELIGAVAEYGYGSERNNLWCNCVDNTVALFRCINCEENLCHNCENAHRRVRMTRDHKIINIGTMLTSKQVAVEHLAVNGPTSNGSSASSLPLTEPLGTELGAIGLPSPNRISCEDLEALEGVPCQRHDGQWALNYCIHCHIPLCRICLPDHHAHEKTPLKESCDAIRKEIKQLEREVRSRVQSIENSLGRIGAVEKNNIDSATRITEDIDKHFEGIMGVFKNACNTMISVAHKISQEKTKILQNQATVLEQAKQTLGESLLLASSSLDNVEYLDLVKISRDLHSVLKNIQPIQYCLQPHVTEFLEFQRIERFQLESLLNSVQFKTDSFANTTLVFGHGIETAVIKKDAYFKIVARNMQGIEMTIGGDDFTVTLGGPTRTYKLKPSDLCDGTYLVRYRADCIGEMKVEVRLRGQSILGSPFNIMVRDKQIYNQIGRPYLSLRKGSQNFYLNRPWGICVDNLGFIYIADRANHKIHVLNHKGLWTRSFGVHGSAPGEFNRPCSVVVDRKGRLAIVDKDNHRVQFFTLKGKFLASYGNRGHNNCEFYYPWDIAQDAVTGRFAVSDTRNGRVQIFGENFEFLQLIGYAKSLNAPIGQRWKVLESPRGVCFSPNGVLFVTDFAQHKIFGFYKENKNFIQISGAGTMDGQLCRPQGIIVDDDGNVLVCDSKNHRIQVFTQEGKYIGKFGTLEMSGIDLERPCDIALGPDGSLIIVDLQTESVHFF